jgi:uncharacterized protein (TIGR03435 family)
MARCKYISRGRERRCLGFAAWIAIGMAGVMASAGAVHGQSTAVAGFDVASVKVNATGLNRSSINRSGGKITFSNVSLREWIEFAFGIPAGRDYELEGPGWMEAEKFDMAATFPPEASRDRVLEMLRLLLAERFHLKTHKENRKLLSYVLVVKRGPKLQAGKEGDDGAFIFGDGRMTARALSMSDFAARLSGPVFKLDRPVVDMTGLKGAYDFTLNWAPVDEPADGVSSPSIFTALQEQLGLKLEARRVVTGIQVVDFVEREPAGN